MREYPIRLPNLPSPIVCTLLTADDRPVPGEETIIVAQDDSAIHEAIQNRLLDSHWHLDPEVRKLHLYERYNIRLGEERRVQIYSFWKKLLPAQVSKIGGALALLHRHLVDPKDWLLKSIQIFDREVPNTKNGQLKRGCEDLDQQRFELYPPAFAEGRYRDTLLCSWLEGTVIHEAVHVCLERLLRPTWQQNAFGLNWETVPFGQEFELAGGGTSRHRMTRPDRCPTSYAALDQADDRAESIVAHLTHSPLYSLRRKLVEKRVRQPIRGARVAPSSIELMTRSFPDLPRPVYRLEHPTEPAVFQLVEA